MTIIIGWTERGNIINCLMGMWWGKSPTTCWGLIKLKKIIIIHVNVNLKLHSLTYLVTNLSICGKSIFVIVSLFGEVHCKRLSNSHNPSHCVHVGLLSFHLCWIWELEIGNLSSQWLSYQYRKKCVVFLWFLLIAQGACFTNYCWGSWNKTWNGFYRMKMQSYTYYVFVLLHECYPVTDSTSLTTLQLEYCH